MQNLQLRQAAGNMDVIVGVIPNTRVGRRAGAIISIFIRESDMAGYPRSRTVWLCSRAHTLTIIYVTKLEQFQVNTAIQQLPKEAREVILLREWEGLSYQRLRQCTTVWWVL